jgi:hypothetical protein
VSILALPTGFTCDGGTRRYTRGVYTLIVYFYIHIDIQYLDIYMYNYMYVYIWGRGK